MWTTVRMTLRSLAGASLLLAVLLGPPAAAELPQRIDTEATYERQTELIDGAFAQLKQTRSERPLLYFVGFAGYGAEAVFKREVVAVRELFDERFGTAGRSIALINHASTLNDIPLATVGNLGRVIERLGRMVDRDRDTLFLFLTSHGEKGVLAVEMPGFGLMSLTPERLKAMLDRSGIQNRIIVISACYSGSFIPALAGPTTLVITAAHASRSSFGCNDKREWTYFGDAFFNRSLRREASMERAFVRAQQLIRAWEHRDRLLPSLPQIAGGEELGPRGWPLQAD